MIERPTMLRSLSRGLTAAIVLSCTCSDAKAQLVNDKLIVNGYVTTRCPSEMEPPDVGAVGIVESLLGMGVSYVIDQVGSALARAAEADKSGRATQRTVPAYLYTIVRPSDSGDPGVIDAPGCLVTSLADSPPKAWCAHPPLSNSEACIGQLTVDSAIKPVFAVPPPVGTSKPAFYAEILLVPSNDAVGIMPMLVALYYPSGLHDSKKFKGNRPRDLSITVSAAGPGGEASLSSVNVILKDLIPSERLVVRKVKRGSGGSLTDVSPDSTLDKAIVPLWHAVAKAPVKASGKKGESIFPVNLSVEVREIGEPNIYLQALAAAFAKNKDLLTSEARSALIPSVAAAEEKSAEEVKLASEATFNTAVADAFKAEPSLQVACVKPTDTSQNLGRAEVRQTWSALASAQANVRRLESVQERKSPTTFGISVHDKPFDEASSARVNCRRLGVP